MSIVVHWNWLDEPRDEWDEDMLWITIADVGFDIGWYRDRFRCVIVKNEDWEHPLKLYETHDIEAARDWLHTEMKLLYDDVRL